MHLPAYMAGKACAEANQNTGFPNGQSRNWLFPSSQSPGALNSSFQGLYLSGLIPMTFKLFAYSTDRYMSNKDVIYLLTKDTGGEE